MPHLILKIIPCSRYNLSPHFTEEDWGMETSTNSPKVTQLLNSRIGIIIIWIKYLETAIKLVCLKNYNTIEENKAFLCPRSSTRYSVFKGNHLLFFFAIPSDIYLQTRTLLFLYCYSLIFKFKYYLMNWVSIVKGEDLTFVFNRPTLIILPPWMLPLKQFLIQYSFNDECQKCQSPLDSFKYIR